MILSCLSISYAQEPAQPLRNTIGETITKFEGTEPFEIPTDPNWVWKMREIPPSPKGVLYVKSVLVKVGLIEKLWIEQKTWIQGLGGGIIMTLLGFIWKFLSKNKKLIKDLLVAAEELDKQKKKNGQH